MPSKIQLDENLWFLYICVQKSDLKTIDFTAVGASTNLKPPAARMRYTRLRRQIESGTLIGTHGTPFTGSADKIFEASTKRKRGIKHPISSDTEDEEPVSAQRRGRRSEDGGKEKENVLMGKALGDGKGSEKESGKTKGKDVKVKEEDSDFDTDTDFEDSEDEIPLAKLRKARHGPPPSLGQSRGRPSPKPYVSPYPSPMMIPGVGGSQVPRSMPGFVFGQGVGGFYGGEDNGFGGLGSAFHSRAGHHSSFGNGHAGAGGWGEMDWARWQNWIGSKEMNGSSQL